MMHAKAMYVERVHLQFCKKKKKKNFCRLNNARKMILCKVSWEDQVF